MLGSPSTLSSQTSPHFCAFTWSTSSLLRTSQTGSLFLLPLLFFLCMSRLWVVYWFIVMHGRIADLQVCHTYTYFEECIETASIDSNGFLEYSPIPLESAKKAFDNTAITTEASVECPIFLAKLSASHLSSRNYGFWVAQLYSSISSISQYRGLVGTRVPSP